MDMQLKKMIDILAIDWSHSVNLQKIISEIDSRYQKNFIAESEKICKRLSLNAKLHGEYSTTIWFDKFRSNSIETFLSDMEIEIPNEYRKKLGLDFATYNNRTVTYEQWVAHNILLAHYEPSITYSFVCPLTKTNWDTNMSIKTTIIRACSEYNFVAHGVDSEMQTIFSLVKTENFYND